MDTPINILSTKYIIIIHFKSYKLQAGSKQVQIRRKHDLPFNSAKYDIGHFIKLLGTVNLRCTVRSSTRYLRISSATHGSKGHNKDCVRRRKLTADMCNTANVPRFVLWTMYVMDFRKGFAAMVVSTLHWIGSYCHQMALKISQKLC
jgi:hypothetical protein